jgi:phosphonate transport system permease protein
VAGAPPGSVDAAQIASLRRRYPRTFSRTPLQRAMLATILLGLLAFVAFCLYRFDATPARMINGLDRFGRIAGALFPPTPGDAFWNLLRAMLESIGMASLGTLIASIIAVPLGFRGAPNVLPIWLFRFPIHRSFDFLRGVDDLVWRSSTFRRWGSVAGVLAIATTDVGILSKLFAEAIENVDRKQIDGVQATDASPVQTMRFGIIPQVLPIMISNALYMFESNSRSATILGIVGAGGIGFHLSDRIRAHR